MVRIYDLRCEGEKTPLAVATAEPRFGWKFDAAGSPNGGVSMGVADPGLRDAVQTAYRLQVSTDEDFASIIWDSGMVDSDRSQDLAYAGPQLAPRTRYFFRVGARMATSGDGADTGWSESSRFETARLGEAWKASFVGPVPTETELRQAAEAEAAADAARKEAKARADALIAAGDAAAAAAVKPAVTIAPPVPPRRLRKEIELRSAPVSARIYATALGLYELSLNGERVGDALFAPGWTSYNKRLAYQTYDVTGRLRQGRNAIGAVLGNGWYKGDLTWLNARNLYGRRTALSLELRVRYADGAEDIFTTDETWKCAVGPILSSEFYHGETYDARLETPLWDTAGFDDASWERVEAVGFDATKVVCQDGPSVRPQERLKPIAIVTTGAGERVLDFGQNLTGRLSFRVRGAAGDRVVLDHAEVLDAAGNFYTANMRSARNRIEYICAGRGVERFEPHFTFQGFRYVRIVEWPRGGTGAAGIDPADFEAVVIHSDMEGALDFECSNPLLNQLHHNILWGWKGNAVDVPTDCPQRDERLGWTGDAQVFIGTASYLMDVSSFFRKWLRDLTADQLDDGGIPFVIPDVLTAIAHLEPNFKGTASSTGWGDAAVICPWTIYARYGDERLLAEQYPSMKAWVEHIRSVAERGLLWNTGFHFGDWVALDAKEGSYFGATPNDLTATAFYACSVELLAKAAAVLGETAEAASYGKLHDEIVAAFRAEFVTPAGRLASRTQTAHILALVFGLLPAEHRPRAVRDLAALLEENGGHLTTGFLGTPFILRALAENSRLDLAYDLLLKQDYPSWLYQITKGATTVWEHWDGLKPDGTMWSADMNSFNHYAYGAVGQWMYETIAGLSPDPEIPGFKSFVLAPQPGGGLDRCRIAYRGPYGEIRSSWKIEGGAFVMEAVVPPNSSARVVLPDGAIHRVGSGSYRFECTVPYAASTRK